MSGCLDNEKQNQKTEKNETRKQGELYEGIYFIFQQNAQAFRRFVIPSNLHQLVVQWQ